MNYRTDNRQCDICAGRGCQHCGRKNREERTLDLCDMYYCGAQFAELVFNRLTSEITINPIDRSTIKDVGLLMTKNVYTRSMEYPIFWPHTKTFADILGFDLGLIVSSAPIVWNTKIIKKIVAYTNSKGTNWEGKEYDINSLKGPIFLNIPETTNGK